MQYARTFLVLLGCVCLPVLAGADSDVAWGKPVHGVRAGIRVIGESTVRPGDQVQLALVLRNTTDHSIDFAFANVQRIHGWRVTRGKDGVYVIAPRSRYPKEEKIELEVAGAITFSLAPGREVEVPMDRPAIRITDRATTDRLTITARSGEKTRIRALPLDCIAKGEEWIEQLETGTVTLD